VPGRSRPRPITRPSGTADVARSLHVSTSPATRLGVPSTSPPPSGYKWISAFQPRYVIKRKAKREVFCEPYAQRGTDLRFLSLQLDTGLHCQITDTRIVHRAVCLFTPLLDRWYSLRQPTEGWLGRVDLGG